MTDLSRELSEKKLSELSAGFAKESSAVDTEPGLQELKRRWLGKNGLIKELFSELKKVPSDDKPKLAVSLNDLRAKVESFVDNKVSSFAQSKDQEAIQGIFIDPSLPGLSPGLGRIHPVTFVERRISELLKPFGFENVLGPEIETEYYCFDSLNIPPHHPARDMQDTLYVNPGGILRTHTTSVQARVLEKKLLPVKIASFGRVYRNETEDASHQAMFHQFELVWVEKGLRLSHLMGLIEHILKGLYGTERRIHFVPKFYPYTEPSIGPQIDCVICDGAGCSSCGGAGWVTVAGAGMVHRNVLKEFGYNPEEVSGFAFGLGTARLASQMCKIPKLKTVYESDLRILRGEFS